MAMKKIIQINNDEQENQQKSDKDKNVSFKKFDKKEKRNVEMTEDMVFDALQNVRDPELPVSIVELGLIYDVQISNGNNVQLKMTLTTPGCSMGSTISGQAENALKQAGANNVLVEIVWDPPWNPDMMTPEAKQKLGIE